MRPDTIGLLMHLFRLGRGMLNAIEAYDKKLADQKLSPYELTRERAAVATFVRSAVVLIEGLLIDAGADVGASTGSDHAPGVSAALRPEGRGPDGRRPGS